MRRARKRSLQTPVVWIALTAIALAAAIAAAAAGISYSASLRDRRSFLAATAQAIENALGLMDATLHTAGAYISHLTPLISIYSGADAGAEALEAAYDVAMATINYNEIVADVIVVARDGKARSYATGEGLDLVELVSGQYDFSDPQRTGNAYFFFPEHAFVHGEMFAYVVPLLDVNAKTNSVSKLATVIIACYADQLRGLLDQGLGDEYACTLTASDGAVIANVRPSGFREGGPAHSLGLKYPYRSVVIASKRAWPFGGGMVVELAAGTSALVVFLMLFAVFVIRKSILRPVNAISREIAGIGNGEGVGRLAQAGVAEIDIIAQSVNEMLDRITELTKAELAARTGLIEARLRKNEAELYALQSQINPHFLFNSLQCVRALAVLANANEITSMTASLSALLRYAISGARMVSIREEVGAVREYLNIVDIRYAHRFALAIDVPESLMSEVIPKMIIQPLVENAVSHGVSMREEGGRVSIVARAADGQIAFTVEDDGPGIAPDRLRAMREVLEMDFHDAVSANRLTSFGLYNIQRRVHLSYGEGCGLSIASEPGRTVATVRIPAGT